MGSWIKLPYLRSTPGTNKIPYLRTEQRTENLKNHTLFRGTYLYSPYMGVPPPRGRTSIALTATPRSFNSDLFSTTYSKKGVTFVMNPAIWVPDVAVWKNNKVTNFYYKVKFNIE